MDFLFSLMVHLYCVAVVSFSYSSLFFIYNLYCLHGMYINLLDLDDFFILLMMWFLSFPNIVLYIVHSLVVFCSFVLCIMKAVDIISSQATVPLTLLRGKIILNSFWSWVLCGYEGSDKFISLNECLHVWSRSCVFHQSCCPAQCIWLRILV